MNNNAILESEVILVVIYTSVAFISMALVLILFYYFSKKKILKKEVEKKDLQIYYQKELVHAVILTQEQERKRIAQDLHDDISSKLNIVSLNVHLLFTPNLSENEVEEIKQDIIGLTNKALENSRRIAHDLLPPVLEKFGLTAAIEELCQEFKSSKQVETIFKSNIDFEYSDENMQLQIFRILQELMNNSLRHGKATHIKIIFSVVNKINTCHYTDNGIGFDIESIQNQKGLGMKNIASRIEILKGEIVFSSIDNQGVSAIFTF